MPAEIADALEVALGWWLVSAGAVVQAASLLLIAIVLVAVPSAVKRLRDRRPRVLVGEATVTDADGLRVHGTEVRCAALDAPEFDRIGKTGKDDDWINHGQLVKKALAGRIGGRPVRVEAETWDRWGRAVGTVTQDGRDIGEWLVRHGHAVAACGDRYRDAEEHAKRDARGMWGQSKSFDPRLWRHLKEARK